MRQTASLLYNRTKEDVEHRRQGLEDIVEKEAVEEVKEQLQDDDK